jgi:hypothetical protein
LSKLNLVFSEYSQKFIQNLCLICEDASDFGFSIVLFLLLFKIGLNYLSRIVRRKITLLRQILGDVVGLTATGSTLFTALVAHAALTLASSVADSSTLNLVVFQETLETLDDGSVAGAATQISCKNLL